MAGYTLLLAQTSPVNPAPEKGAIGVGEFCPCDFRCEYEEKVFADDDGDGIKNDFSDFIFRKISDSDTIVIKLFRYDRLVATITDDTYGTYYNGFDNQPLYVGWVADWTKIFNDFTGGLYQVKVDTNILGVEEVFESRFFRLNSYDSFSADGTVKIESVQNGKIENDPIDYTDLIEGGWKSSLRIDGKFGQMIPSLERDIYLDSSWRNIQNRDETIREYSLSGDNIPENLYTRIVSRDMLGNSILITSYDQLQEQEYERFPVVPNSFSETNYIAFNRIRFVITMGDRQKNVFKRNF